MWKLNSELCSYAEMAGASRRHRFASSLTWGDLQGEEAQCDGVLVIKLVSSPEPLNCLFVFKLESVPALLRGSFNEPEGKGLKAVWGEGHAMGSLLSITACKAPSQPTAPCLCCSALTAFSSWGQHVFPSKLIERKSKRQPHKPYSNQGSGAGRNECARVKRQGKWWTHPSSRCALLIALSSDFGPRAWQSRQLWHGFLHVIDSTLSLSPWRWRWL